MLKTIITTLCILAICATGVFLAALVWFQVDYQNAEQACGDELNQTCFVVRNNP